MAFSDYKNISQVQKEFSIIYKEENFIGGQETEPPDIFRKEFEFNREHMDIYTSEASRSEVIIFPVLREVWKNYSGICSFWIQKYMKFDEKLSGTPDYIISARSGLGKTVLEVPLLIAAEAKKNDFEQGWGQCLAELVASQKINGSADIAVHGIVTDGKLWEFGRLSGDIFIKNIQSYTVDTLPVLFGVLNTLFKSAAGENEKADRLKQRQKTHKKG
jgi:hypothetical protein